MQLKVTPVGVIPGAELARALREQEEKKDRQGGNLNGHGTMSTPGRVQHKFNGFSCKLSRRNNG